MEKLTPGVLLVLAALLYGCSPAEQRQAETQTRRGAAEAESAAKRAAGTARRHLSDGALTLKVKGAMAASDRLDTSGIDVSAKNGVVYLEGHVKDLQQKTLAHRIAESTLDPAVKLVDNLGTVEAGGAKPKGG
ncbi:MAG TPA: BON domain-containing protein [Armatimonadota bacterium]|jgi:osmotically-inducible protein OsmY